MGTARVATLPTARRRAPKARAGSDLFIWREALWGLDWLSLRLSPVFNGQGVPRGDGSPVVLVPGFLTTDAYLVEMYFWLRRVGYDPHVSGIGVNAGCMDKLVDRLERTVEKVHADSGRPARIVGHSLGGFLARKLALRRPDIVSQIISLGSPIQALQAHPALMAAAQMIRNRAVHRREERPDSKPTNGIAGDCDCAVEHCVPLPPPSVHRAALYSHDDGVIDWRNCMEPEPHLNFEVGGTHVGLVFNPRVYRVIGELLAEATAESEDLVAA
jgi:triacylglycerol lipase